MDAMPTPRTLPGGLTRFLLRLLVSLTVPPLVAAVCIGVIAVIQDGHKGWFDLHRYLLVVLLYSAVLCAIPALLSFAAAELFCRYGRSSWRDRRHYLAIGATLGLMTGVGFAIFLAGFFDARWETTLSTLVLIAIGALSGGLTAWVAYRWRRDADG